MTSLFCLAFKLGRCYHLVMKTSMNLYFNTDLDTKLKFDKIKTAGFDEFFTGIYDQKENMAFMEQMAYAQKIGLPCTMVHCSYHEPELNNFWLPGLAGDCLVDDYIRQIKMCGQYTKNFVVHLNGSRESVVSEIGLRRLQRMLKVCESFGLNLCVENLYSVVEIPYIFTHIQHPLLKICYDSGHRNCLTPKFEICKEYGQYISALHLHENDGTADQHKHLTIGSPVFRKLQDDLQYLPADIVLASEARDFSTGWEQQLQQDLDSLKRLAQSEQ